MIFFNWVLFSVIFHKVIRQELKVSCFKKYIFGKAFALNVCVVAVLYEATHWRLNYQITLFNTDI